MLILQRVTQSEADCSDERQAGQIDEEQDSVIGCHMLYEPFEFDFMNIMKNILSSGHWKFLEARTQTEERIYDLTVERIVPSIREYIDTLCHHF